MNSQETIKTLFVNPTTPYGAYPFDKIKLEELEELIDLAIAKQRDEINAIETNPEPPTFRNTSLALEEAGEWLEALLGFFYNLLSANSNDSLARIAENISPKLSQLASDISLSEALFKRIETLYQQEDHSSLSPEEHRLLFRQYEGFVRGGALLASSEKAELREINQQLSLAALSFGENARKESKLFRYYIPLSQSQSIASLPQAILQTARLRQSERKLNGYLFSLDAPEYNAIMAYAEPSEIRRAFYEAKMRIGYCHTSYSNDHLIRRLVNLRLRKAQLLGFQNFAEYRLATKMLNTPEKVYNLLEELQQASAPKACSELEQASKIKGSPLEQWDINYYLERLKEEKYNFSAEKLRPYFPLERVIKGVLGLATKLYGIAFVEEPEIPTYDKEVRVFRVEEVSSGDFLALLYLDFFPREGKRSGAWMNNLREATKKQRPHVLLVMNFTPPTQGTEALLLPSEVHTFLHEFGHALHGMLTEVGFSSLSGTNVTHDFVELPSQIHENWLFEKEFLQTFAHHYETGEAIPQELIEQFKASNQFRTGYDTQRQLAFGFLDMAWHTITSPLPEELSLEEFEKSAFAKASYFGIMPHETLMSASFSHLFSGGYAAGYYGYKWSEVLATDAYALFKERGVFDRETAQRFRKQILARGDSEDPSELYRKYRGKDPDINALIQRDGF